MAYEDSGIRYRKGSHTHRIVCEDLEASHKLRFRKGATTVGLPLVATDDDDASDIRIFDGTDIKCLARYGSDVTHDVFVWDQYPDDNWNGYSITCGYTGAPEIYYGYINQPRSDLPYLNLYCYQYWGIADLDIYNAGESWDESTLTWNNQPALGSFIKTVANADFAWGTWIKINIGTDLTNGIVLRSSIESGVDRQYFTFFPSEYWLNPYWSKY